jgi:tetratricopeptide (TPR) repeat protein
MPELLQAAQCLQAYARPGAEKAVAKGGIMIDNLDSTDRILASVERELERNPDSWEAQAAKADILFSLGMYGLAIRCCDRSLAQNPDNVLTWVTKVAALKKLGRKEEEEAALTKAMELGYKG